MKTVEVCYDVRIFYCPNCKALYFREVDCHCLNALDITKDTNVLLDESEEGQ